MHILLFIFIGVLGAFGWLELPGVPAGNKYQEWSGFVRCEEAEIFYWGIKESGKKLRKAIVWFQGGPGASSLEGMFHYGGPWAIENFSEPRLKERAVHFAQVADTYFIEAPGGVGFSRNVHKRILNDTVFGQQAGMALCALNLEKKYDSLVVAGESYSGVFIPLTVDFYLRHCKQRPKHIAIYVGNGCVGTDRGPCVNKDRGQYTLQALAEHSLVTRKTYDRVLHYCDDFVTTTSQRCRRALIQASSEAGPRNTYNLRDSLPCQDAESFLTFLCAHHRSSWACEYKSHHTALTTTNRCCACSDHAVELYLQRPDLRAALNISESFPPWLPRLHGRYRRTVKDLVTPGAHPAAYFGLVSRLDGILIAAGLDDAQVPAAATVAWVNALNLTLDNTFRPEEDLGPRLKLYRPPSTDSTNLLPLLPTNRHFLMLATLPEAGHSLLKYQPASTIGLIEKYLFKPTSLY